MLFSFCYYIQLNITFVVQKVLVYAYVCKNKQMFIEKYKSDKIKQKKEMNNNKDKQKGKTSSI